MMNTSKIAYRDGLSSLSEDLADAQWENSQLDLRTDICCRASQFSDQPASDTALGSGRNHQEFGVSPITMYAKSKIIRDGLDLMHFTPGFTVASRMETNPLVWNLKVNEMMMDI